MKLEMDTTLNDIIRKHKNYYLSDEHGRGISEENIDYLIKKARILQAIENAFYSIECYKLEEARDDFYAIIRTILENMTG